MSPLIFIFCLAVPAADTAPGRPLFVLHFASEAPQTGTLKSIDDKWSVVLGNDKATRIEGVNLVSLRRLQIPMPAPPNDAQVLFANGDRLPGTIRELKGDQLAITTSLGDLTLPVPALSVLWFDNPGDADRPDQLRRRLLTQQRTQDVVSLRNGDSLEGNLVALTPETLTIEVNGKEVKVERSKLAVVALNNELARTMRPKEMYAQLVLTNGTRLGLLYLRGDEADLVGKTLFGATVKIPVEQVAAVDMRQGKADYLSDLKPTAYQHTPYLPGLHFPYIADASVAGNELRVGGGTYDKGVGMHTQSKLTYALDGKYRRFEALVGLDDATGRKGSALIKILVDGKLREIGLDKELKAGNGPRAVKVDVAGAKELTLIAEFGKSGVVQGQVDWADARLVK